jgi:hypothetical protein
MFRSYSECIDQKLWNASAPEVMKELASTIRRVTSHYTHYTGGPQAWRHA